MAQTTNYKKKGKRMGRGLIRLHRDRKKQGTKYSGVSMPLHSQGLMRMTAGLEREQLCKGKMIDKTRHFGLGSTGKRSQPARQISYNPRWSDDGACI